MIVVTGGAGFIGCALIHQLNDLGRNDIIVVDRCDDLKNNENLNSINYDSFIDADEFLTKIDSLSGIQVIFHMGACSSTLERNLDFLEKNNVQYTKDLWNFCRLKNIPYIYASSAATYGDGENGYDDDHQKIKNLKPLNPYGDSKQRFDEWALSQEVTPDTWFGLKFFNVFGPWEYHKGEMRSVVHKAFGQIKDVGLVRLFKSHRPDYNDGEQLRDFVYVKDVCQAMIIMWQDGKPNQSGIYNMGTGVARSFKDLVTATFNAMGVDPNIEYFDMPESIRGQYQYFTQANMNKFRQEFSQMKFHPLEEAVLDYVKNHLIQEK